MKLIVPTVRYHNHPFPLYRMNRLYQVLNPNQRADQWFLKHLWVHDKLQPVLFTATHHSLRSWLHHLSQNNQWKRRIRSRYRGNVDVHRIPGPTLCLPLDTLHPLGCQIQCELDIRPWLAFFFPLKFSLCVFLVSNIFLWASFHLTTCTNLPRRLFFLALRPLLDQSRLSSSRWYIPLHTLNSNYFFSLPFILYHNSRTTERFITPHPIKNFFHHGFEFIPIWVKLVWYRSRWQFMVFITPACKASCLIDISMGEVSAEETPAAKLQNLHPSRRKRQNAAR